MPRFHFEVVDGYTIEDPLGVELPTEDQAKAIAHRMAEQISNDVADESLSAVVVKTDSGKEIYTAPIRKAPSPQ
ncbi:DUF6894 family protein [Bradyrhizobium ivorense]|uniref:DUF6894 family protein n=1 Tax=Bradyrhizobium ivorense TaxID=2511166 RepID=UPI0010BA4AD1|nr:hypothetical protein [Bradyrhizobium ivorense]VIO74062.1 hypothetical protein CI41S_41740 [Bradyrhizobium ivorense]